MFPCKCLFPVYSDPWAAILPLSVEIVPNRHSPRAILLRAGWREDGQVRKRPRANLSPWPKARIDARRRVLIDESLVGRDEVFEIIRSFPHGPVAAVRGTLRPLRLDRLIDA